MPALDTKGLFVDVFSRELKPFNYFIGGRGIGKTYSALYHLVSENKRFIYMRNTIKQIRKCRTAMGNPFKRLNSDHGWNIQLIPEEEHCLIVDSTGDESGKNGRIIGYAVALSEFETFRGIDLSDVSYCLYDEFIQRKGKLQYNQFEAFVDFYETVARNREILGEEPFRVICCSNAQKVGSEILAGYGLIPHLERLIYKGGGAWRNRVTHLEYFPEVAVSGEKAHTALYEALGTNNRLSREFLKNEFAHDSFAGIKNVPLREYTGLCCLDDMYVYVHKSTRQYHVCRKEFTSRGGDKFNTIDQFPYFMRLYGVRLKEAMIEGRVTFSEYFLKMTLAELFKL